ncbi:hypothetical protein B9G98_04348 [Wickerhamiella sorbophila]|uniref:Uncharacterized protein n=1 Tax=Wickerhamiella sorbophila TaxID=45607 RepID=A0A2T0FP22_9ASCO|nr:hypothetical protein B9G98_04348 [Wickerhamiella sorbophila]PRT56728.1 hypothetical protein B9G98_04348 [Wickerhamiella sorbophila]
MRHRIFEKLLGRRLDLILVHHVQQDEVYKKFIVLFDLYIKPSIQMQELPRVARNVAASIAALSVALFWPQTLRGAGVLGPRTFWRHGEAFHVNDQTTK